MIDTHNHLLPGLDDGAQDIGETLKMCRMAVDDGIRVIVATPHSFDGKFLNHVDSVKSLVRDLNTELTSIGLDVTIMPGMEVRITEDLPQLLADGKILTLNEGKYVSLEIPPLPNTRGVRKSGSRACLIGIFTCPGPPRIESDDSERTGVSLHVVPAI